MNSGTSRTDRPDASTDVPGARTRSVQRATATSTPTTAQLIHRTDASIARPLYAALGVALHHFTEMLVDVIEPLELHRATTVLTKQVCELLDEDDSLEAISRLVTDPTRVALPDGRHAIDVCGDSWEELRAIATRRSMASHRGAEEFGLDAILNLAVVRSVGADEPWWGTPLWKQRVGSIPADALTDDMRAILSDEPELAPDDVLSLAVESGQSEASGAPNEPSDDTPAPDSRAADSDRALGGDKGVRAAGVRAVLTR